MVLGYDATLHRTRRCRVCRRRSFGFGANLSKVFVSAASGAKLTFSTLVRGQNPQKRWQAEGTIRMILSTSSRRSHFFTRWACPELCSSDARPKFLEG